MPSSSHVLPLRAQSRGLFRRVLLSLLLLTMAGGCAWWYFYRRPADSVAYQTIPATKGDITQSVTATGTINPVVNIQVGSQISGIIQKLFVDYNSPVKAGQIVAQIDPATYKAAVMQAEGDLASAKAALELAQVNARRNEELRKTNATSQANVDQTVATLHQAEASVRIKEGALERASVDLERCTIASPIDGIVISSSISVGQTVAASLQAPVLFTIANDLAKMQIDSNVAEADVGNVEEGQAVEFTVDAYPTRAFHGKVIQVRNAPNTVQNVVSYDTVIEVKNDDLKLKPGMTAIASIIVATRENAIRIGNAALRFRLSDAGEPGPGTPAAPAASPHGKSGDHKPGGDGKGMRRNGGKPRTERTVYVLREGKSTPEAVQIKVGITDGVFTEVLQGLNEGDQVVTGMTGPAASAGAANPFGAMPRRF